MGVKGAAPLGCLPLGERGGHPRNFHASQKTRRDFYRADISYFFIPVVTLKKTFCPAVPLRGPEAGSIVFRYDFHCFDFRNYPGGEN